MWLGLTAAHLRSSLGRRTEAHLSWTYVASPPRMSRSQKSLQWRMSVSFRAIAWLVSMPFV